MQLKQQISDNDCIISDSRNGYTVKCELDYLGEFKTIHECLNVIENWIKRNYFYPNIYFINDHGNMHLINLKGEIIQSQI